MPSPSLAALLDQLYAADPAEFVVVRKQLQGQLRAAGQKPEAALLGRARRPSTAMWAVNQMVRRRPELVDTLLERSDALRSAQTSGDRDALREAIRAHRAALADATAAALEVLESRANDAFREEILSVLRAASTQPEPGSELRLGRLVRSDDITPEFPEFDGFTPEPGVPRSTRRATQQDPDDGAARAAEDARRELARARDDEAAATATLDAVQRRVDELNDQLAGARSELRDAHGRLRRAKAETVRLERRSGGA